ncbi:MAG: hypothetical protein ACK4GR_06490, partial [bacterium]
NQISGNYVTLFEKDMLKLKELIKLLPEEVFITPEDSYKGVIVFCMDFFEYFEEILKNQENYVNDINERKGLIFVRLKYIEEVC